MASRVRRSSDRRFASGRFWLLLLLAGGSAGVLSPTSLGRSLSAAAAPAGSPATRKGGGPPSMLWPLDRPPSIVSSFGEYRYDHMHAGIDISTGGATGLKVRAAEAGQVVRLKVEWRGYGRALYLRHADGRTTVYAHLERYEDAVLGLERIVARRQAAAGTRYPGDIYLDPAVPVKRGQVLAFSGESGAGPPHLHFEVRGPSDQPLDPFRAGLRAPADRDPPVLESVTITAADPETYIDGVLRERTYPLERRGGPYQSREAVRVSGRFQAALSAYDAVPGGRVGLRFLEVSVDGNPTYRLDFPSFRFDQYPQSGLVHDHRLSHMGPTRFGYRLSRLPGNALATGPSTGDPGPGGWFDLPPGPHRLDLVAGDAAGARSRGHLCVFVGLSEPLTGLRAAGPDEPLPSGALCRFDPVARAPVPPAPPAKGIAKSGGDAATCLPPADTVEGEIWSAGEGRFLPLDCRPPQGLCWSRPAGSAAGRESPVRVRAIAGGVPGPWQEIPAPSPGPADPASLQVRLFPAFLDLLLPEVVRPSSGPADPRCPPSAGGSWRPREGRTLGGGLDYQQAVALASGSEPAGSDCLATAALRDLALTFVAPGEAARLAGPGYRIDMPAGARFFPGPLAARRVSPAGLPAGLLPAGAAVEILPEGEALDARATLSFDSEAPAADARSLGIFRLDPVTTRWSFEGDSVESGGREISVPFRRHGQFALLRDDAAPSVVAVRPRDGARQVGRRVELWAQVDEVGKGLGPDGVAFVLDGILIESEFDPDRGTARPFKPPVLAPGRHHLRVVATDRAGNVSLPMDARFDVR